MQPELFSVSCVLEQDDGQRVLLWTCLTKSPNIYAKKGHLAQYYIKIKIFTSCFMSSFSTFQHKTSSVLLE